MSDQEQSCFTRPFLKWAGNKYRVLKHILPALPTGDCLVEPFAGSCAVFLNTDYPRYLISDVNPDLIQLFQVLQQEGEPFIHYAKRLFTSRNNSEQRFYQLRQQFNTTTNRRKKAALFIYLNRHCYNGLCRYNKSHQFNVPFGRYKRPYFPEREMRRFHIKAQRAEFICQDFRKTVSQARNGSIIYADPPYLPLNTTAHFTSYSSNGFDLHEQEQLAREAEQAAQKNIPVLISNHDTPYARKIYQNATLVHFNVRRSISCNGQQRNEVAELLALFKPD
ncbi:MAG TPA: Dam family site-specific DNA-(adenine-N6)-methyltransferase [Gammaproteobacteria bacterium]|nr:Dam family site-specific DNA-(adenine-N6)-methyltransferase [Gammaproteobacteria bacterium]